MKMAVKMVCLGSSRAILNMKRDYEVPIQLDQREHYQLLQFQDQPLWKSMKVTSVSPSPIWYVIKTHKTGSTTITSLFERFADICNTRDICHYLKSKHVFSNYKRFSRKFVVPIPEIICTKYYGLCNILANHAIDSRVLELDKTVPGRYLHNDPT